MSPTIKEILESKRVVIDVRKVEDACRELGIDPRGKTLGEIKVIMRARANPPCTSRQPCGHPRCLACILFEGP